MNILWLKPGIGDGSLIVMRAFWFLAPFGLCLVAAGTAKAPADPKLDGYRKWTKVNPSPARMNDQIMVLCAAVSPARMQSPHRQKYITVYVNKSGKAAMMDPELQKEFPVGSTIVKEKLPEIDSKKPELMTVMVKRAPGFAPDDGDWEYFVTDASGKVLVRGAKETKHCADCHRGQASMQYVFRTYAFDGGVPLRRGR